MSSTADEERAARWRRLGRWRAIGLLLTAAGFAAIAAEFVLCIRYEGVVQDPQTARERFCMGDNLWALLVPTLVFMAGLIVAILAFLQRRDIGK